MKRALMIITLFCSSFLTFSQVDTIKRRYDIKYCKITFEFFNGPQKGTRTIIFDDWGIYEKQVMRTEWDTLLLKSRNIPIDFFDGGIQNELYIIIPSFVYQINLNTKTGGKIKVADANNVGNIYSPNKKKIGNEVYIGKMCEVFLLENQMKLWIWNGVCLKTEMTTKDGERMGDYAIDIDTKYIPTKSDFEVPSDIIIE